MLSSSIFNTWDLVFFKKKSRVERWRKRKPKQKCLWEDECRFGVGEMGWEGLNGKRLRFFGEKMRLFPNVSFAFVEFYTVAGGELRVVVKKGRYFMNSYHVHARKFFSGSIKRAKITFLFDCAKNICKFLMISWHVNCHSSFKSFDNLQVFPYQCQINSQLLSIIA